MRRTSDLAFIYGKLHQRMENDDGGSRWEPVPAYTTMSELSARFAPAQNLVYAPAPTAQSKEPSE